MNTALFTGELAVAGTVTTGVTLAISADPLLSALIGFGTALVTMVGGELVKYLVAFFKAKRENLEKKDGDTK